MGSCSATAPRPVSYTHLRAHETRHDLVCRLLLEKKKTRSTGTGPARAQAKVHLRPASKVLFISAMVGPGASCLTMTRGRSVRARGTWSCRRQRWTDSI